MRWQRRKRDTISFLREALRSYNGISAAVRWDMINEHGKHAAVVRVLLGWHACQNRKWHLEQRPVTVHSVSFSSFNSLIHWDVRLNTSHGSEIRSFMSIRTVSGLMWAIIIDSL